MYAQEQTLLYYTTNRRELQIVVKGMNDRLLLVTKKSMIEPQQLHCCRSLNLDLDDGACRWGAHRVSKGHPYTSALSVNAAWDHLSRY